MNREYVIVRERLTPQSSFLLMHTKTKTLNTTSPLQNIRERNGRLRSINRTFLHRCRIPSSNKIFGQAPDLKFLVLGGGSFQQTCAGTRVYATPAQLISLRLTKTRTTLNPNQEACQSRTVFFRVQEFGVAISKKLSRRAFPVYYSGLYKQS